MSARRNVCRACDGPSESGLLVCRACWRVLPPALVLAWNQSRGSAKDMTAAARDILSFLAARQEKQLELL